MEQVIFLRIEAGSCGVGAAQGHRVLRSLLLRAVPQFIVLLFYRGFLVWSPRLCGGESRLLISTREGSRPHISCSTDAPLLAALHTGHPQGTSFFFKVQNHFSKLLNSLVIAVLSCNPHTIQATRQSVQLRRSHNGSQFQGCPATRATNSVFSIAKSGDCMENLERPEDLVSRG